MAPLGNETIGTQEYLMRILVGNQTIGMRDYSEYLNINQTLIMQIIVANHWLTGVSEYQSNVDNATYSCQPLVQRIIRCV